MQTELCLPQLSDSMSSAKLAVWLKREGDPVTAGEPVVEIETEKTNVEIEAPVSGVLQKICVEVGTDLQIGQLLAVISEGQAHATPATARAETEGPELIASKREEPASAEVARPAPIAAPAQAAPHPADQPTAPRSDRGILATPLARRMAAVTGLDLAAIPGTGPRGQVVKSDIERVLRDQRGSGSPMAGPAQNRLIPAARAHGHELHVPSTAFTERPLTAMRRVTAERLLKAKQTVPHFYLQIDCVVDGLLDARSRINAASDVKLTITDFVIRAAALALRKVPLANSSWADNAIRVYEAADIAVAVATPAGLITPIIRDVDRKTLGTISRELKALSERARLGQLKPNEYSGGTFTVSNLGMYGVGSLYAIVNAPQSCILGVGAIEQRPVVRDGELAVGRVMTCTLSVDHRAIDGATGAEFLATFRPLVEEPWMLLLQ